MLPSTGLLIYWLDSILDIPVFANKWFQFLYHRMTYHIVLPEYTNLVLSSFRYSLPFTYQWDCLLHLITIKYFSLFVFLISFHILLNMTASTRSFTATLVFQRSKELTLVQGNDFPRVEKDDRPKNFFSSITQVLQQSPSAVSAISDLFQYWFSSISVKVSGNKHFSQFPPRFLICWFLFHILIWPWIHFPIAQKHAQGTFL